MKLLQDDKGNLSLMRLIVIPSSITGIGTVVMGVIAMFRELPTAGTAMSVGAGMVAAALAMKGLQKRYEQGS
jgi:hypothetical protein